jgi:adenylyl cyclase-associated protein
LVSPTTTQTPAPPAPEPLPASVEDFDDLIANEVATFVEKSMELGGLVGEQVIPIAMITRRASSSSVLSPVQSKAVEKCFAAQRKFLVITTKARKPGSSTQLFVDLVAEMQAEMTHVSNLRENNRVSPLTNHLSTVSEGIPGLSWVTLDMKPASYVKEMLGAAQFFGNRVITSYKDKYGARARNYRRQRC